MALMRLRLRKVGDCRCVGTGVPGGIHVKADMTGIRAPVGCRYPPSSRAWSEGHH
jgi:hypothetical protein